MRFFEYHGRRLFWPVLAMTMVIALSNVAVNYPLGAWGGFLTWASVTYPFNFLVNDVTNRRFGPRLARLVVYISFGPALVLSFVFSTPRIAVASLLAWLAAHLLNIAVFHRIRKQIWWQAPLLSTALASVLDTALFYSLAFAFSGKPWMAWAVGDFSAKVLIGCLLLLPYRLLTRSQPAPDGFIRL